MSRVCNRLGSLALLVLKGPDAGKEFKLEVEHDLKIFGGRSRSNQIILADEHVSADHFELDMTTPGVIRLRDRNSTNGIKAAGMNVYEATLDLGAEFRVGNTLLRLVAADMASVSLPLTDRFGGLLGRSERMREVFGVLDRIATNPAAQRILLLGENGTGKDLAAREIHMRSERRDKPFIVLECTSVAPQLLCSRLFGQIKGAFTGAQTQHGCFVEADGGTLFIDEIGDLPLPMQGALLHVLEHGEVVPVGMTRPRRVDVRVITATHRDLRQMVSSETFREDLYHRLAQMPVTLPSLRDRAEDIPMLARHFLTTWAASHDQQQPALTSDTVSALMKHRWTGNVRELRNTLERAAIMCQDGVIRPADLVCRAGDLGVRPSSGGALRSDELEGLLSMQFKDAKRSFERCYAVNLLASGGTYREMALRAGVTEMTLINLRRRHGLPVRSEDFEDGSATRAYHAPPPQAGGWDAREIDYE